MKIKYKKITIDQIEGRLLLNKNMPHVLFNSLRRKNEPCFLFESKEISSIYGKRSIIGIDPILRISGKDDGLSIEVLNGRGEKYLENIDLNFCDEVSRNAEVLMAKVFKSNLEFEEKNRYKQKNISLVIRKFLEAFKHKQKVLLGLYGAFSYDFVRQFERLQDLLPDNDINDFDFFLYDTFVFFDHVLDSCELVLYRNKNKKISVDAKNIKKGLDVSLQNGEFSVKNLGFELPQEKYEELVEVAKDYCKKGEIVEVVFSNLFRADFEGDPYALYLAYREKNPSPYMFYFDYGDQQLVGSSPEMMLKVDGNRVQMRPISGTIKRGNDLIEDHENMLKLLCDSKERAELDMLIDLGRNDLNKVCKPGLKISDYRFVEKYSKVMHTIANIEGELESGFSPLDALFASLNAGTLTGAPKVAAMNLIEKFESERRGFYGGTIGYFTFSGEMDTAILIRTAHIKNKILKFRVGATLLNKSVPALEYAETMNKAAGFISILQKVI